MPTHAHVAARLPHGTLSVGPAPPPQLGLGHAARLPGHAGAVRLIGAMPAGLVPAFGALPSLLGGVRAALQVQSQHAALVARRSACREAHGTLVAGLEALGGNVAAPAATAPLVQLMRRQLAAHQNEARALALACDGARLQLGVAVLELAVVLGTAVPQLHALLGLVQGAAVVAGLRARVPVALALSGVVCAAQHLRTRRALQPTGRGPDISELGGARPPDGEMGALRDACADAARQQRRYAHTQALLWLGFSLGMATASGMLVGHALAPLLGASLLGGAIVGISAQHLAYAPRFGVPPTLWRAPSWDASVAFADADVRARLWAMLGREEALLELALRELLPESNAARQQLLRWAHRLRGLPGVPWVQQRWARLWLGHPSADAERRLLATRRDALARRREAIAKEAWHLHGLRLQAASALPPCPPPGALRALSTAQAQIDALSAEAQRLDALAAALDAAAHTAASMEPLGGREHAGAGLLEALEQVQRERQLLRFCAGAQGHHAQL